MKFENKGKWLKQIQESTQKNEDFRPDDIVPYSKQMDFKKQYVKGTKLHSGDFYFDNVYAVDDQTGDTIPNAKLGMKYKDLASALNKYYGINESAQKNEAMPPVGQRKRIDFEDDIVKVYDGNKEIYAGAEDYEPMKDEDWKWDNTNKYYKFGKYIKVCCESAQKNEDTFKPGDIACLEDGKKVKILDIHPGLAGHGDTNPSYVCRVKALYGSGHIFSIEDYKLDKCNESAQKNEAKVFGDYNGNTNSF